MRFASLIALSLFGSAGCVTTEIEPEAEDELLPVEIGVAKADGPGIALTPFTHRISDRTLQEGGTFVITSRRAWIKIMFSLPPPDVDFTHEWVVFHGLGIQSTDGFAAELTSLTYDSVERALTLSTLSSSPGPGCTPGPAVSTPFALAKFEIPSVRPKLAYLTGDDESRTCEN